MEKKSIKGALLMLAIDELDEEEDVVDEPPEVDELVIGGGFVDLLLELEIFGLAELLPTSLSCEDDVRGVFRATLGDVCGL
jgi:hypothetical protein